ncbi:MAG TPA: DNA polymerase III subunit beta [Chlamydiales bacterium]|jgi:DNA polymerase-3 subunit beta|nr:DNA polymerase III subunit beta [Chlamydiales bacterium]
MKAVVSKADLVAMIGKIQSVVASKPAIPILANILIEAKDDQVILSATDLTVSMRCYIEAKVIEEGAISLPGKKLFQLIRELTSPQIKISATSGDAAEITTGTSVFKINGLNKNEFPALPDLSGAPQLSLQSVTLKEMLSKTAFSAAREDTRYMLNGIKLSIAGRLASFIGTDGKRLAKCSTTCDTETPLQSVLVLPLKAVEEMIKLLDDSETHVKIALSPDKISLESGSQTLIAKLLSGQFPDVEKVIPAQTVHQFSIHREELMSLLRQISLFTSENSHSVRFAFETGQLHLSATSQDIGEGRVSMPVDFAGPRFEIAFNPYYMLDILRHSKDETVKFGLNDSHNPGLITDSSQALFVIMPMRLSETSSAKPEHAPAQTAGV